MVLSVGNSLCVFFSELPFFARKRAKEQFAQKNKRFPNLLIFGEQFTCSHSFLVSNLTKAHIALYKRGIERIASFLKLTKIPFYSIILSEMLIFCERKSNSLRKNRLLFCHEWPEGFTHGHSFSVSDLSKSLTVDHFW